MGKGRKGTVAKPGKGNPTLMVGGGKSLVRKTKF